MTARWTNHHEILREFIRASFGAGLAAVVTMPAAAQGPKLTSPPGLLNARVIIDQDGTGSQTLGRVALQRGMLIAEAWRRGEGTLMVRQVDEQGVPGRNFLLLGANGRARNIVAIGTPSPNARIQVELTGLNRETDAWGVKLYQDSRGTAVGLPVEFFGGADIYGPIDFKGPGAPYEEISWEYVGGRGVPPMHLVNADGHAIGIIGDPRVAGSTGSQIVDQQGPLWFTWVTDGTLNGYLELRVRIANTKQAPGTNAQVAARGVAVAADAGVGAAVTEGAPPSAQPRRAPPAPPGTGLRFRKVLEPRLRRAVRAELEFTSEMQSQDNVVLMWKMTGPWSSEGLVNLLTELGAQVQVQSMAGTTLVKVSDWTIDGTLTEGDVVAASGQLVFSLKVMR